MQALRLHKPAEQKLAAASYGACAASRLLCKLCQCGMVGFSKAGPSSKGWFYLHFYGCDGGLPSSHYFWGLDIRLLGRRLWHAMAWVAKDGVKAPLTRPLPRPEACLASGLGISGLCGYVVDVWCVKGGMDVRLAHLALDSFPGLCVGTQGLLSCMSYRCCR